MIFKKKNKTVKLMDFSIQNVSSGQVDSMLKNLEENVSGSFKYINVQFGHNETGDTRCYLTTDRADGRVIQWFKDRNPSQVEEFAKSFE